MDLLSKTLFSAKCPETCGANHSYIPISLEFLKADWSQILFIIPWSFEDTPRIDYDSRISSLDLRDGDNGGGQPMFSKRWTNFNAVQFSDNPHFVIDYILGISISETQKFFLILKKVLRILPHESSFSDNPEITNCLVLHLLESFQTLLNLSKKDARSPVISVLRGIVVGIDEIQIRQSIRWTNEDRLVLESAATGLNRWLAEKRESLIIGPKMEN